MANAKDHTFPTHNHSPHLHAESDSTNADVKMMPCGHKMNGRNLVVCIDGTSNQFGEMNTNVIELYNLVLKEVEEIPGQLTWYNSGIGTYAQPSWKSLSYYKQALLHKADLAIAWSFERTVLGAYRWLSDNYKKGDCIFMFGFSRGAFQVRVLSAMIDKVGLIYKGNEMQIPFAYQLYVDPKSDKHIATEVGSQAKMTMADRFKNAFSHKDVKVHFVGAWDTVSSIGITRGNRMLPRTIDGMKHVCYFRHALALDERRVKFLPEYAYGGTSKDPNPEDKNLAHVLESVASDLEKESSENTSSKNNTIDSSQTTHQKTRDRKQTLEVWFPGTHSDIGGGNVVNTAMDRSRPPLRWMVFEAGAVGLRTALFERELLSDQQIEFKESLKGIWWLFEYFPIKRMTYTRRPEGKTTTRWFHRGSARKIHPDQKIHSSLIHTSETRYKPRARPLDNDDDSFWRDFKNSKKMDWLERDLYEDTIRAIEEAIFAEDTSFKALSLFLRRIGTSSDGRQALYEKVIEVLSLEIDLRVKYELLRRSLDVLDGKHSELKLRSSGQIRPSVSKLSNHEDEKYQEAAQKFMLLSDPCMLALKEHKKWVWSTQFSPDGKYIASGSLDKTVRIWDVKTGEAVEPFQQKMAVYSVAFSPDGKQVASGSSDGMIWIWDVATRKIVGEPFQAQEMGVNSLAFSPDGKQLASGSLDKTVRIWNVETMKELGAPFEGHTNSIHSVVFSPSDGKLIASGSSDQTIRIWNVETGVVKPPFQGHENSVHSVAFSPDGKQIASGSSDQTIRIWDVETGEEARPALHGHTNFIYSVAFSPDGKHIASGSWDKTVRIWDVETGKAVGEPFQGHRDLVVSVAFSPDGKRIASSSNDCTVRIWDVETRLRDSSC